MGPRFSQLFKLCHPEFPAKGKKASTIGSEDRSVRTYGSEDRPYQRSSRSSDSYRPQALPSPPKRPAPSGRKAVSKRNSDGPVPPPLHLQGQFGQQRRTSESDASPSPPANLRKLTAGTPPGSQPFESMIQLRPNEHHPRSGSESSSYAGLYGDQGVIQLVNAPMISVPTTQPGPLTAPGSDCSGSPPLTPSATGDVELGADSSPSGSAVHRVPMRIDRVSHDQPLQGPAPEGPAPLQGRTVDGSVGRALYKDGWRLKDVERFLRDESGIHDQGTHQAESGRELRIVVEDTTSPKPEHNPTQRRVALGSLDIPESGWDGYKCQVVTEAGTEQRLFNAAGSTILRPPLFSAMPKFGKAKRSKCMKPGGGPRKQRRSLPPSLILPRGAQKPSDWESLDEEDEKIELSFVLTSEAERKEFEDDTDVGYGSTEAFFAAQNQAQSPVMTIVAFSPRAAVVTNVVSPRAAVVSSPPLESVSVPRWRL